MFLARVLQAVGLTDMAARARLGHFDDHVCPPHIDDGFNIHRLVEELDRAAAAAKPKNRRKDIEAIGRAAREGEFAATEVESKEWAASPDGLETFRQLIEGE
jgi:hypothetical protein